MMNERRYTYIFLFFAALISTVFNYQFGLMDHIEHLPLLFRVKDPNYLVNDFFLNANQNEYDPRYFYSLFILFLLKFIPIAPLFFTLTLFCNILIGWASYRIANYFFNIDKRIGLLAIVFVLSVSTVSLGSLSEIHAEYLTPNILSFALVLNSFFNILNKKWVYAALILSLASFFHPLAGPESGLLFFGVAFITQIYENKLEWKKYIPYLMGSFIFLLSIVIVLSPFFLSAEQDLDTKSFIDIYAHFRAPHHILPSHFLTEPEKEKGWQWFLILFIGFIYWFSKNKNQRIQQFSIFSYIITLLLLSVLGYIFTEIYPNKIIIIAQIFRLLYLLKWLALIFLAAIIGTQLWSGKQLDKMYALVIMLNILVPFNVIIILSFWAFTKLLNQQFNLFQGFLIFDFLVLCYYSFSGLSLSYQSTFISAEAYLYFFFFIILIVLNLMNLSKNYQYLILTISTILLLNYSYNHQRINQSKLIDKAISRQYSLKDLDKDVLNISQKIKELTDPKSILLTPPDIGEIRFLAERALVVNFKTYPFKGKQLKEWQDRLFKCYTWTDKKGFDAVNWAFIPNYKVIDKERLNMIAQKYGADYAVLYAETPCDFPILYENKSFKLAYIGNLAQK
jgi:hypothetical protein